MKIAAIIQARMGSTRLPGKSMALISGKPMLYHIIERVGMVLGDIYIATTPDSSEIRSFAKRWGIPCFLERVKGDVLDRFYQCAKEYAIENIVRITGDNPLIDPEMLRNLIDFYWKGGYDWAANCRLKVTYPVGNDAEIFSFKTLEKAWESSLDSWERECVTAYIYNHPELFKLGVMENKENLAHLRWTVDTAEDLERVRQIYFEHYKGKVFGMKEIFETGRVLCQT